MEERDRNINKKLTNEVQKKDEVIGTEETCGDTPLQTKTVIEWDCGQDPKVQVLWLEPSIRPITSSSRRTRRTPEEHLAVLNAKYETHSPPK